MAQIFKAKKKSVSQKMLTLTVSAMDHQGRVAFWCATGFTEEWEDFEHWAREVWLTRG